MHTVSGSISLPSPGFFSPFPHGTCSLSVSWEYLALEDGPPIFNQDFTCPDLLVEHPLTLVFRYKTFTFFGLAFQPVLLTIVNLCVRALPISLATTFGISVDFFSSGYWDVSLPQVRFVSNSQWYLTVPGCPIRTSTDQCLFVNSPSLFADYYVLPRLQLPRHPPYALLYLTI